MRVADFSYSLPAGRIAERPASPRGSSRLLVMDRRTGGLAYHRFFELPSLLRAGDVLVLNDSKVIKARLIGKKETGGRVEVFLVKHLRGSRWEVLVRGNVREGTEVLFAGLSCTLTSGSHPEVWEAQFSKTGRAFDATLERIGHVPLPPYIKTHSPLARYQTVYAKEKGSVAAPTAGLHFTPRLFRALRSRGVQCEFLTLHVGLGTFQPVKTERVEDHVIHSEWASLDAATARRLNAAHREGRRIIAVGTTSVRTLEAFADVQGRLRSGSRDINLFMYPGYHFRAVDAMITNFHLPKSSLLMLVSAFAGREHILRAYSAAIRSRYRFYSFGDAMLIQ